MSRRMVQRGRRQELLNLEQPRRIRPLRFTVGDARRRVAIADEDQAAVEPALQVGFALVAVGDVEQLHHVGAMLALALQRARDLFANRCGVVGKRHQPRLVAVLLQAIAKQFGLCLLAALIEAFEGDEMSGLACIAGIHD